MDSDFGRSPVVLPGSGSAPLPRRNLCFGQGESTLPNTTRNRLCMRTDTRRYSGRRGCCRVTVRTQHPLPSSFRGPEPWQSSSRSLSRCLRRRTHVNDPGSFSERSVVVYSNDVNAFPSNIFHEKTRSLHSAFAAKNDCATPTGGHVHHCISMITDHIADR